MKTGVSPHARSFSEIQFRKAPQTGVEKPQTLMPAVENPGQATVVRCEGGPAAEFKLAPVVRRKISDTGFRPGKKRSEDPPIARDMKVVDAQWRASPNRFAPLGLLSGNRWTVCEVPRRTASRGSSSTK